MLNSKIKISVVTYALYIVIIGIGMYTSYHVFGAKYSTPEMFNSFWLVEIILSILVFFTVKKFFSWEEVGVRKVRKKHILWILPMFIIIALILFGETSSVFENGLTNDKKISLLIIGFSTLLVGFSEEIMFRGILLNTLLKEKGKYQAVFISSIAFALLHSVNILAGLSLTEMLAQLIFTFILGLFFALVYLRLNSILPLIILHFLWDFSLLINAVTGYNLPVEISKLSSISFFINTIVIVILMFDLRKHKFKNI